MKVYARQGDLVITKTNNNIDNLGSETNPVLAGSAGSEHIVKGPVLISRGEHKTFLQIKNDTVLTHGSRHRDVPLPVGTYEITRLRERGDATDRWVED